MSIPREVFGASVLELFGPVRPFLEDPSVSEVMINGPDQIIIERQGQLLPAAVRFSSAESILCALRNVAQFAGKRFDAGCPILEARLPDGSRLEAIMPPAAPDGPFVAIRRFSKQSLELEHLLRSGSLSSAAATTLAACVEAKLNVIVAGGTGSGKTSLLNLLTRFVPERERTIVIEDSKEVQVQRPHVLYLEARPADEHGRGQVSIRDLFRATLRMHPDRIIIGEIRGAEAIDIVQAMVSGHGGCMATVHATHPRDTLARLETLALTSGVQLPLSALRQQIASGLQLVVQVARGSDGSRLVTHISELRGLDASSGRYELVDLFERVWQTPVAHGRHRSELLPTGMQPSFGALLAQQGLALSPELFVAPADTRRAGPMHAHTSGSASGVSTPRAPSPALGCDPGGSA